MRIGVQMQQAAIDVLSGCRLDKALNHLDFVFVELHFELVGDAQQKLQTEQNEAHFVDRCLDLFDAAKDLCKHVLQSFGLHELRIALGQDRVVEVEDLHDGCTLLVAAGVQLGQDRIYEKLQLRLEHCEEIMHRLFELRFLAVKVGHITDQVVRDVGQHPADELLVLLQQDFQH